MNMDTIFYTGKHEHTRRPDHADTKLRQIGHGDATWVIIINALRAGASIGDRNDNPPPEFHIDWSYRLKNNPPAPADREPVVVEPCTDGHFWHVDEIEEETYCAECGVPHSEEI
jgi:hypothetical protein